MPESPYNQDDLEYQSDADHVRERYRMYIGDVEAEHTANCLIRDAFCLAIDQILANTCSLIRVTFTPAGAASIDHDGTSPGIEPENLYDGKSETEMIVSVMRFCQRRAAHEYVAENVCRNSFPVVNFLSEHFRIDNFHPTGHWSQTYARGVPTELFHRVGACNRSGVCVEFKPDQSIFRNTQFDAADIIVWFKQLPIDHSKFAIKWVDQRRFAR